MAMLMTTAMAVPLRSLPKLDVDLRGEVSVKKIAPPRFIVTRGRSVSRVSRLCFLLGRAEVVVDLAGLSERPEQAFTGKPMHAV